MIDAPVVWIAEETPEAARALSQWASARGIRIVPAAAALPYRGYAETEVTSVEQALAKAREAVAQLDADAAERQLARAEATLRAHPELPQAGWLMAEVQRGWAQRFARVDPKDDARAKRAQSAADALDGGHAAGVGDLDPTKPTAVEATLEASADPDVAYLVDARPVTPGRIKLAPGEHHVTATSNGRAVFADWIAIADGARIKLEVQGRAPCSRDDLAHASDGTVRCGAWIAASAALVGGRGGVRASLCRGASCEPAAFFAVRLTRWPPLDEPDVTKRGKGIPSWLGLSIAGVTVAGAVLGILGAAGVFAPAERRIVFTQGGVQPE